MITAYILLQVSSEYDKNAWDSFTSLSNVVEAAWIYGEFDTLLKVEAPSLDALDEFIFSELRKIEGIKSTKTLLVAKMKQKDYSGS